MKWLAFKTAVKKLFIWVKEHWQIPLLFLWTIAIWVFARRNTDAMIEVIEAKKESYKKQVEVLKTTHNDELLARDELIEDYQNLLKGIEEKFTEDKKKLTEKQKNDLKEVIIKSKGNPDEIRKKIEEEFGFSFVE